MTHVTDEEWRFKADNFQNRIKNNPYPENLQWYRDVLAKVEVGKSVLDVGCGSRHVEKVLPEGTHYIAIDPFPRDTFTMRWTAEQLNVTNWEFDTVIAFATLDNVQHLPLAIHGLWHVARKNVVIVTGINIEPDHLHTVKVTRDDLTKVMGEPYLEEELTPNVFLYEYRKSE